MPMEHCPILKLLLLLLLVNNQQMSLNIQWPVRRCDSQRLNKDRPSAWEILNRLRCSKWHDFMNHRNSLQVDEKKESPGGRERASETDAFDSLGPTANTTTTIDLTHPYPIQQVNGTNSTDYYSLHNRFPQQQQQQPTMANAIRARTATNTGILIDQFACHWRRIDVRSSS